MECPHCGALNSGNATFCSLCHARLGEAAVAVDAVAPSDALIAPDADEHRRQRLEEAEMWRKRREGNVPERAPGSTAAVEAAAAEPAFAGDVDVMLSVAEATHRQRIVKGIGVGAAIFFGVSVLGIIVLARADWAGFLSAHAQTNADIKAIAQRYLVPTYWRFLEAAVVYLFGAAVASWYTSRATGGFGWGFGVVAALTALQAGIMLPILYHLGQDSPLASMLGFGLAFLCVAPLVGGLAGAAIGVRTAHRRT